MTRTAVTQLRQQIETVRREAFTAGYAAAMEAIREVVSSEVPDPGSAAAAPRRRGRPLGRGRARAPQAAPALVRPARRRRARSGTTARATGAARTRRPTA